MSYSAWLLPYQAFRFSTWTPTPIELCRSKRATANCVTHGRDCTDNDDDQNQRTCPRLTMPIVIRRVRVYVNLQRQRGNRLVRAQAPECPPRSVTRTRPPPGNR